MGHFILVQDKIWSNIKYIRNYDQTLKYTYAVAYFAQTNRTSCTIDTKTAQIKSQGQLLFRALHMSIGSRFITYCYRCCTKVIYVHFNDVVRLYWNRFLLLMYVHLYYMRNRIGFQVPLYTLEEHY